MQTIRTVHNGEVQYQQRPANVQRKTIAEGCFAYIELLCQLHAPIVAGDLVAVARDTDITTREPCFCRAICPFPAWRITAHIYQIVRSFEQMMEVAIPKAWAGRKTEEEHDETLRLHMAVAEAIADQKPDAARHTMEAHFARSIGDLFSRES